MLLKKPANTPLKHWYSGIFLILVSVVLIWFAVSVTKERIMFMKNTSVASGVVVKQNAGRRHVMVQFTTANGEIITYPQNGMVSYEVGDSVNVLYLPENPTLRATTDDFGALWDVVIFIGFFVVMTLSFGLLSIFMPQYVHITGDK